MTRKQRGTLRTERELKAFKAEARGETRRKGKLPTRLTVQGGKKGGTNFEAQYARSVQLASNCGCRTCTAFVVAAHRLRGQAGRVSKARRRKLLLNRDPCINA